MSDYAGEMLRCQQVLVLRAVIETRGNMCAAAKLTGLHRNTVLRTVRAAGYKDSEQLKLWARSRVDSAPPKKQPARKRLTA